MKKETKPDRKAVIKEAYEKGLKNNWHAREAAVWATKKHGSQITKSDIQHHAMRSGGQYLDEMRNGLRYAITK